MPNDPPEHDDPPTMSNGAVISFYLGTIAVAVVWAGFTDPGLALLIRLPVEKPVNAWIAAVASGLFLVVAWAVAERVFPSSKRLTQEIASIVQPVTPARVAALALSSGIAEELLFRGPVQHSLGFVIASVLFGLLHGGISKRYIMWSTFALLAGLIFGVLAEYYQSVWPPALAHVVVNGINLARLARVNHSDSHSGGTESE